MTTFTKRARASLCASFLLLVLPNWGDRLLAAPITLGTGSVNMFRDIRAANDVGIAQGDRFQYGANVIGGSTGTTLGAIYGPDGFTQTQANCQPLAVNLNFCARSISAATVLGAVNRQQPWTLNFQNGSDVLQVTGPSLAGTEVTVPFPVNVTISGSGVTPTISWSLAGRLFVPDGFRVEIFDRNRILANGQADLIFSTRLGGTASSFTFSPGILQTNGQYTIELAVIRTRLNDATPDPNDRLPYTGNPSILVASSSYFDFAPLDGTGPPDVHLPTIVDGVYHFNVTGVGPTPVTFIDPVLAIGYIYASGAGDPNFASVLLPTGIGDNLFDLYLWDGSSFHDSGIDLTGGTQYFFGGTGVDRFEILGIETSAGLNPANPTAFITGLTFVSAGDFTGTMTPVTLDVPAAVSEPSTLFLLVLALVGLTALQPTCYRWLRHQSLAMQR